MDVAALFQATCSYPSFTGEDHWVDMLAKPDSREMGVRAYDIAVCVGQTQVADFHYLPLLGMAVRLALHLRGVPALGYRTIRMACLYLLDIPVYAVNPVLSLLAEAGFVRLYTQGRTIKTVIPDIPYYEQVFSLLTDCVGTDCLSEPEWLTAALTSRLAKSPIPRDQVYQAGAEQKLVERVLQIGSQVGFVADRYARGRSVLYSPTYFVEDASSYADIVVSHGSDRVNRVLRLLKQHQGWPLALIEEGREIGGKPLSVEEVAVAQLLAGEGFIAPPAIATSHSGLNYFLFGPRPGPTKLPAHKRPVHESAMAIVAAVRQGQLLPDRYAIRNPVALLNSLKNKRYLRANTEATEQYRQVAALRIGRLVPDALSSDWARFEMIDRPENDEALDRAIQMLANEEPDISPNEELTMALRKGHKYVESLIGPRILRTDHKMIAPDDESREALDTFLLGAASL